MKYLGNIIDDLCRALNRGETQYVLRRQQMEQLVDLHIAVVDAKNVTARENLASHAFILKLAERLAAASEVLSIVAEKKERRRR